MELNEVMNDITDNISEPKEELVTEDNSNGKSEVIEDKLPAWTSQLPDEIKKDNDFMGKLKNFAKIGDLAKSYSELEKKLGSSIVKPSEDASEEEKAQFYEQLGKPKTAKEYELKEDKIGFSELAHKLNLSKDQAQGIYNSFLEIAENQKKNTEKALKEMFEKTDADLRQKHGDKYSEKITFMKRGIEAYGGKSLGAILQNAGLLYHPEIVNHFILLGEQNAEAQSITKGSNGGSNAYKSNAEGGMFNFNGLKE